MSYILDALKRADAERGQSGSHALAEPATVADSHAPASRRPDHRTSIVWGSSILALLLLGAVAAWGWQRWASAPPDAAPDATLAAPSNEAINSAPADTTPPAPPPAPTLALAPEQAAEAPPAPAPAASAPAPVLPILAKKPPAPPPPPPTKRAPEGGSKGPPPGSQAQAPDPTPKTAAAPESPAAPAVVPALSAAARAALPQIQVSGSSYSANREHRMLIANGQVVKEGQELSPGLTLEVIGPRSAVFNHRGTRFNINY